MQNIDIGIPIDLQKLLDTRALIQAGSGGGKSYLLRKLIESVGNQVQQIIIDPEGEFITLREKFNFILAGKGGDIPLTVKYAETLAHKILELGASIILDLSELKVPERIAFVRRFLEAMIAAPRALWHPCLVYVDEAHIFCPESDKSESAGAVIDLCSRGRKRGFAAILATQRLPKLHKDATAECQNKLIGLATQDIDRARAGKELGFTRSEDVLKLRELLPGEFFAFGPAISNQVTKFKVAPVITTHLMAGSRAIAPPPTPAAIQALLAKLAGIPEEAEKDLTTREQLQAEVTRLRAELTRSKTTLPAADPKATEAAINRAVIVAKDELRKNYQQDILKRDSTIWGLQAEVGQMREQLQKIHSLAVVSPAKSPPTGPKIPETSKNFPNSDIKPAKVDKKFPENEKSGNQGSLGKCPRAIISFLAGFPDRDFTKAQIGVATGYSVMSSGFQNSLSELTTRSFIIRGERIKVNYAMVKQIKEAGGTTTPQVFDAETFKKQLGKCELEIYNILLKHPTRSYTKEALAAETPSGYSPTSSGFQNSISRLSSLELAVRVRGQITLNPELLELL